MEIWVRKSTLSVARRSENIGKTKEAIEFWSERCLVSGLLPMVLRSRIISHATSVLHTQEHAPRRRCGRLAETPKLPSPKAGSDSVLLEASDGHLAEEYKATLYMEWPCNVRCNMGS
jgi:hypothetical protein